MPHHAPGAKRTPFVLLLGGLVVGGLCALLALNTASAANEVERHDLALRDQNIAAQLVQLQNDQQASAAPANLARAAEALGMVPGGNPGFLEISSDGHVRLVGQPAPATAAPLPVPSPTHTAPAPKHAKRQTGADKKDAKKKANSNKAGAKQKRQHGGTNANKDGQTKAAKRSGDRASTTSPPKKQKKPKNQQKKQHTQSKHRPQSRSDSGAGTTNITIPGGPR
jgi:hypothetical protein